MTRLRLVRALLTLTTFVVVWLVAAPARASQYAPLCDPRGATGFAPPPQMQDPEVSLDIVASDDDCAQSPLTVRHVDVQPHRAPASGASAAAQDPVHVASLTALARARGERLPAPAASPSCARAGFRATLQRPPRA